MSDKYERFIASYLRLNAYFTITNFIVHAGDDSARKFAGHIGNYTETDILGIRMPYSEEKAGPLFIANHECLVTGGGGKIDVVIAEVKSGKNNKPNGAWTKGVSDPAISYVVRFIGLHDKCDITHVANTIAKTFQFEDNRCRFRYVIFAHECNKYYSDKGVTYITFRDIINFLVIVRGQSWINSNLGVASSHPQWDEVLNEVFSRANDEGRPKDERVECIEKYLST